MLEVFAPILAVGPAVVERPDRLRDGRSSSIAELWEHWEGPARKAVNSCTLLATSPNDLIATFHHRMPVVLDPQDYDRWLDPGLQEAERLQPFLRPFP